MKPGPHGKLTGAFSKWWARFTDDLGVTDPLKTFHSLRHCFKDACRAARLSEEVHDALTGHVSGAVGRTYGRGVPLPVLADAVAKVTYPGTGLDPSAEGGKAKGAVGSQRYRAAWGPP